MHPWSTLGVLFITTSYVTAFDLIREYAGTNFFDGWDFYGNIDNLTWGNVTYVTQEVASSQDLAYVTSDNRVIIKVDNVTNVPLGGSRNSVRITTQDAYDIGSLWLIDLNHIPWGCSVWPAFWSFGPNWPNNGEIDIIEGINLNTDNQYAIHTTPGCYHSGNTDQLGSTGATDCSQGSGCTVGETSQNSFFTGFANANGGVFATQFDVSGIFMWFWSRPDIPSSISQATSTSSINVSSWGTPHAAFLSNSCNISEFFSAQNLVLDITLCGVWGGVPGIYDSQCAKQGSTGICYNDCVVGPGSPTYDNAYFDLNYVRTYTTSSAVPGATSTATTIANVPSPSGSSSSNPQTASSSGAIEMVIPLTPVLCLFAGMFLVM
ncbi:concanavalin A-like lectin/glucanase domain-containing protein [Chiua virens]|nr:concanavalin A-like lectin/glucanase domain-containing protein [Chiua virens]